MPDETTLESVLMQLVAGAKNPAELLETYYWSQEEGVLQFIRNVLLLPPQPRKALMAVFKTTQGKSFVRVDIDNEGKITLELTVDSLSASSRMVA